MTSPLWGKTLFSLRILTYYVPINLVLFKVDSSIGTLCAQKMCGCVLLDKRVEGEFTECLLRCYLYKEAGMILSREAELVSQPY